MNGPNFVAPGDRQLPAVVQPAQVHEVQPVQIVQSRQELVTTHVDRARGFTLETVPLAGVVGIVALLVALALGAVPLASLGALVVLGLAFGCTWLVAWVWHTSASPDGIGLWQVLLHYRLLRHEQRARLERMKGAYRDDSK